MYLKDEAEIRSMKEKLFSDLKMTSGGSAANTIYGASGFGLSCAYCGRVQDDEAGFFVREMKEAGIHLGEFDRRVLIQRAQGTALCWSPKTHSGLCAQISVFPQNFRRRLKP